MGGGTSRGLFSGTIGAVNPIVLINNQQKYLPSNAPNFNGIGMGGTCTKSKNVCWRKKSNIICIDYILLVLDRYLAGKLSRHYLVDWLQKTCSDSLVSDTSIKRLLEAALEKLEVIVDFNTSCADEYFQDTVILLKESLIRIDM